MSSAIFLLALGWWVAGFAVNIKLQRVQLAYLRRYAAIHGDETLLSGGRIGDSLNIARTWRLTRTYYEPQKDPELEEARAEVRRWQHRTVAAIFLPPPVIFIIAAVLGR
jgi:hypothetical protein